MTLLEQIRDKREAAARALKAAQDIRTSLDGALGDWPADKQEAFDRAMKDFGAEHEAAGKLQTQQTKIEELDRAHAEYTKPIGQFPYRSMVENAGPERKKQYGEAHNRVFQAFLRAPSNSNGMPEAMRAVDNEAFRFSPEEKFALMGTQSDVGGFLVPPDFRAEVLRAEMGIAVFRQAGARVVPTSSNRLVFPTITGDNNVYPSGILGAWKPEGYVTGGTAPPVQSKPNTGQENIPVNSWQPDVIEVTQELLMDSAAPLDSIIAELLGETKALDEDGAFIVGDGVGKPEGIMNAGVTTVASAHASQVTYTGLLNLFTALPVQYRQRGSFLMNSATMGAYMALQTTAGFLIFPPNGLGGLPAGAPTGAVGMMLNRPLFISEFMADIAAGASVAAFGDFSRYIIAERTDLRLQRLTERYAPNIGILATARLGGQLTRTNSFRIQKVQA